MAGLIRLFFARFGCAEKEVFEHGRFDVEELQEAFAS